jgi:hypothetical protein
MSCTELNHVYDESDPVLSEPMEVSETRVKQIFLLPVCLTYVSHIFHGFVHPTGSGITLYVVQCRASRHYSSSCCKK